MILPLVRAALLKTVTYCLLCPMKGGKYCLDWEAKGHLLFSSTLASFHNAS